jgi:phage/plasmid-like protein (TIGR03299 family)
MAHEIEGNNALFIGQPAWHGLGTVLKDPPSLQEAIRLAGLDWKVRLAPLQLTEDQRAVKHMATVRESDGRILGVVGPGWRPLQNVEAFDWFAPFIESGSVKLEAAGSLRNGQRVWVLGRVAGGEAEVTKGDPIEQFVLLANSHDGSLAIRVGFTMVRVVCQNTLQASLDSEASKLIRIHHTGSASKALKGVAEIMDVAKAEFAATTEQLKVLAGVGCSTETLRKYVRAVFAPIARIDDESAAKPTLAKVVPLFEGGRGAELSRGTLWGAYNAVTEYITHERGKSLDTRVEGQWFGDGAKLIQRALDVGLGFAAAAA